MTPTADNPTTPHGQAEEFPAAAPGPTRRRGNNNRGHDKQHRPMRLRSNARPSAPYLAAFNATPLGEDPAEFAHEVLGAYVRAGHDSKGPLDEAAMRQAVLVASQGEANVEHFDTTATQYWQYLRPAKSEVES